MRLHLLPCIPCLERIAGSPGFTSGCQPRRYGFEVSCTLRHSIYVFIK